MRNVWGSTDDTALKTAELCFPSCSCFCSGVANVSYGEVLTWKGSAFTCFQPVMKTWDNLLYDNELKQCQFLVPVSGLSSLVGLNSPGQSCLGLQSLAKQCCSCSRRQLHHSRTSLIQTELQPVCMAWLWTHMISKGWLAQLSLECDWPWLSWSDLNLIWWLMFLAWHWTCLIPTNFPDDLVSLFNLPSISGSAVLALLGMVGPGLSVSW